VNLPTFTAAKLNDFTVVGSYKHANEVATNTQDCITSTTTTAINMPKINTEDQLLGVHNSIKTARIWNKVLTIFKKCLRKLVLPNNTWQKEAK